MSHKSVSRREFVRTGVYGMGILPLGPRLNVAHAKGEPANQTRGGKVKIAVVQQASETGNVDKNQAKAHDFVRKALEKNPDIIVFHELMMAGYVKNARELAEPVDGPTTRAFQALLKESETLVLYGLAERAGENCYSASTLVGRQGVVANYRKTHLWWKAGTEVRDETKYYSPGNELVTFDLKGHKCGIMICYDGKFPEMTRSYANLGCTMLFWPNNRPTSAHKEVQPLASANSMIMAVSNACGKNEAGHTCRGASNVTDKDGALITEIWDQEGIIYAEVDPSDVLEHRSQNPWWRGQRPDLYHYV
jgi:predicted amidohydrolase